MKKKMLIAVLLTCAILLLTACGGSSIVGKWTDETTKVASMEFKSDGNLVVSLLGQTQTVQYKVEGDKVTTFSNGVSRTSTFKIEGNKLTITTQNNKTQVWIRDGE